MTDFPKREGWLIRAQVGIIALTMLGTLGLSVFDKPAAPFAIVGLGVLLLLRFGDIASLTLKGFGAEAVVQRAERAASDADKAAEDALQTIEALKELGKSLAVVALTPPIFTGNSFSNSLETTLISRDLIVQSLESLGCTPAEIKLVMSPFQVSFTASMLTEAIKSLPPRSQIEVSEPATAAMNDPKKAPDIARVRALFKEYGSTDEAENWLDKIERFLTTGYTDIKPID